MKKNYIRLFKYKLLSKVLFGRRKDHYKRKYQLEKSKGVVQKSQYSANVDIAKLNKQARVVYQKLQNAQLAREDVK